MRGKTFGALLGATVFTALTGTAHAGYAHVVPAEFGDEEFATFDAQPHEAANLRFQVTDGGRTVTFEDLANPITPGTPPTADRSVPCEIVSERKARCTAGTFFTRITLNTGLREAEIRDVAGDGALPVDVNSGPLRDVIDLDHQEVARVRDDGGPNEIGLGAACVGCAPHEQLVEVGPGASTIDVRNGDIDYVFCVSAHRVLSGLNFAPGSLYPGEYNVVDSVLADPQDHIDGCAPA